MLKLILLVCAVGAVIVEAAPVDNDFLGIKTIDQNFNIHENGYQYNYELDDGQTLSQTGYYKYVDEAHPKVLVVEGSYSFIAMDGNRHVTTYTADENGYQSSIKVYRDLEMSLPQGVTELPSVGYGAALPSHLLSLVG